MHRIVLNLMKLLAVLVLPLVILTAQASAVDVFPACSGTAKTTPVCRNIKSGDSTTNPIIHGIGVTIQILSIIIGVAAVIMIIVGGLSFMTAGGDAQAIGRARSSIIYALVGIIIAGFAQVFVTFILSKL
jgi:hypothetical protein